MAAVSVAAIAGNKITLSSASGHPGDEVSLTASLTNDDAVTAVEMLVPLNEHVQYVAESATLNTGRTTDHTMSAAVVDDTLRVYIYSLSLSPLAGNEGELFSFKVKLGKEPADYELLPKVILGNATGVSLEAEVESGTVTLLSPKLTVTTTTITWGRVAIRSSYNKTLTFTNSGNEPLEVSAFEFSNSDFATTATALTVAPGASQSVTVKYSPMVRGTINETVSIVSNAVNGTQKAQLTATPFSVNELHVLRASGVSDEEVTIALRQKNMEPIVGLQCEFAMPEQLVYVDGSFTPHASRCSDHQALSTLVDGKLSLYIYSPTNAAIEEGNDTIATFKVRLNGTNGNYYLRPQNVILSNITEENMTSATSQNYVTIKSPKLQSADALDMGLKPVTQTAQSVYSIYNSGQVDMTVERITFLAEGYIIAEQLPMTVGVKETKTVTVKYNPTVKGTHSTVMQVYTNDPLNRMKSVAVSGEIFEPNYLAVEGIDSKDKSGYGLKVSLDNYTEIVALQMDIHWIEGMATSSDSIKLSDRLANHSVIVTQLGDCDYRVVIYSMTNASIADNIGELFTLGYANGGAVNYYDTTVTIDNIVMSTAGGVNTASKTELTYEVVDISTGIEEVPVTDSPTVVATGNNLVVCNLVDGESVDIYDLSGCKIGHRQSVGGSVVFDGLSSGMYIVRTNNTAVKVKL